MTENKPIRIAQIMGKWVGGGVEAVVMNYYRYIDRNKIQFDFICDEDSTCIPYEEIEKFGGKVILIPPYQKIFKYHKELKRVLKDGNYKIVHSHINTLSVFSLFAAKCAGVPVRIAHSHATTSNKEFLRNIIKKILKPFNRLFSNVYMSCSKEAGIWMFGKKNFEKNNIFIINNAIETKKFVFNKVQREKYRKKYNIASDEIVIGQVGRLVQTKNHLFSIDIFKKYNKLVKSKLVFAGSGPMEKEIMKKIKKENLEDKFIFLGQVFQIQDVYSMCDVLLLPSLYEGFGMTLIEAQTSNLPCIVSTGVPNSAKIVDNVEFIELKETEKWIKAINHLTKSKRKDNSELIDNKGFNIEKECEKLEHLYQKLSRGDYNAKN